MDCAQCGGCCKHVAIEIDTPKTKQDYNHILWYLLHDGVSVFVDDDGWNVEFAAKCGALKDKNLCDFYKDRPEVCRDYDADGCVRNGSGSPHKMLFTDAKQFLAYMKKKGINYRYKKWD